MTQTTFVNALRALERGEQPRKPENWLITIAHNIVRQRWRQEQSRPREVELDREVATLEADDDGPSIDDLVRALQRIPPIATRGARPPRAGGPLVQGDRLDPRRLADRARDADLPRPPLARRGAREPRHVRPRRARALAADGPPARPQGAEAPRRAPGRVPELCPDRGDLDEAPARLQGARAPAAAALADPVQGRAERVRRDRPLRDRGGAAAGGGAAAVGAWLRSSRSRAAVDVASGAGYEGVKAVRDPATPVRPSKPVPAAVVPASATPVVFTAKDRPLVEIATVKKAKPVKAKPAQAKSKTGKPAVGPTRTVRGKSATAPGQLKKTTKLPKLKSRPTPRGLGPAVVPPRERARSLPASCARSSRRRRRQRSPARAPSGCRARLARCGATTMT